MFLISCQSSEKGTNVQADSAMVTAQTSQELLFPKLDYLPSGGNIMDW